MGATYLEKLRGAVPTGIGVCVGLDPQIEKMPPFVRESAEPIFNFNAAIVDATVEVASAYKPNLAFYERFGVEGLIQLQKTLAIIPKDKIVILDAKRGDIGSTAEAYAEALFSRLGGDAATVSPYLGGDAISPFLADPAHGAYVLAVTSNPGGADLQELKADGRALYFHVVDLCRRLNKLGNVGIVAGATRPELWPGLLEAAGDLPLLVPGVGAQGGDPVALKKLLEGYPSPALVNSSRAIIHASSGENFKEAARDAAMKLFDQLNG